jgi:hypothetical protein
MISRCPSRQVAWIAKSQAVLVYHNAPSESFASFKSSLHTFMQKYTANQTGTSSVRPDRLISILTPDRSDDLLYPSRWSKLLALPPSHSPDIIQIISWNDYGESHNIAPISGAQPGSEGWTNEMSHEAFREMTWYFIGRWRDNTPEVGGAIRVWMWYRTHPARMVAGSDEVGSPEHSDWVSCLFNHFSSSLVRLMG